MKHGKRPKKQKRRRKTHFKIIKAKLVNRYFHVNGKISRFIQFKTETALLEKLGNKFVGIYFRG